MRVKQAIEKPFEEPKHAPPKRIHTLLPAGIDDQSVLAKETATDEKQKVVASFS